jgi:NhaP-type Na+/H+ or K+/H+ antiporter
MNHLIAESRMADTAGILFFFTILNILGQDCGTTG